MAREIKLVFASGEQKPADAILRSRLERPLREFMNHYSVKSATQLVIDFDAGLESIERITVVDDRKTAERFKSNLEFTGQITDLRDRLEKQSREIKGLQLANGKLQSQLEKAKAGTDMKEIDIVESNAPSNTEKSLDLEKLEARERDKKKKKGYGGATSATFGVA